MTLLEEIRQEQKAQRELLENIYQILVRPGKSSAKPGQLAIKLAACKMIEKERQSIRSKKTAR